jgi:Domain of unknown function (DUF4157)
MSAIAGIIFTSASQSAAGLLDKVKKAAGDVGKTVVKTLTVPSEVIANTAKAATGSTPPSSIFLPFQELGKSAGNAIDSALDVVSSPQRTIYRRVKKEVAVGGPTASFVFDVASFNDRLNEEAIAAGGTAAADRLSQKNPIQSVAWQLAAAIRLARERHLQNAKPLPNDVKQGLASTGFYAPAVLDRAKYTVGTIEITLPNSIGKGNRLMGDDHAVTVDDIIVFNRLPPAFTSSPTSREWWGHEVTHVEQYQRWGVDEFAYRYAMDYRVPEGEAKARGRAVRLKIAGRPG